MLLSIRNMLLTFLFTFLAPILSQPTPPRICSGTDLFIPLTTRQNFDDSQKECESLGGSLTTVNSEDEFNFLVQFISDFNLRSPWVGIHNPTRPQSINELDNFEFIDGTDLPEFHGVEEPKFPPWFTSNDLLGFGRPGDNCVHLTRFSPRDEIFSTSSLNDLDCNKELQAICKVINGCPDVQNCLGNDLQTLFEFVDDPLDPVDATLFCDQVGGVISSQIPGSVTCLTTNGCLLNEELLQIDHPSCFADDLYIVFQEGENKENQVSACNETLTDGVLPKLTSSEQFNFINALVEPFQSNPILNPFYLGISSSVSGGSQVLTDFTFDDGTTENLSFIHQDGLVGQFPWRTGDPNNGANGDGNEECVAFAIPDAGLVDLRCSVAVPAVCQGKCPKSSCLENDLFIFVDEEKSFDDAQDFCFEMLGGNLARISNDNEHDFVTQLIKQSDVVLENGVWIGVRLAQSSGNSTDPADFVFVDPINEDISFFDVGRGNFPWDATFNEPGGENEDCVEILGTVDFWNDLGCDSLNRFVCRVDDSTACPAIFPGPSPTPAPGVLIFTESPMVSDINPPNEDDSTVTEDEFGINLIFAGMSAAGFVALTFVLFFFLRARSQLKQMKTDLKVVKEEINKSTA